MKMSDNHKRPWIVTAKAKHMGKLWSWLDMHSLEVSIVAVTYHFYIK